MCEHPRTLGLSANAPKLRKIDTYSDSHIFVSKWQAGSATQPQRAGRTRGSVAAQSRSPRLEESDSWIRQDVNGKHPYCWNKLSKITIVSNINQITSCQRTARTPSIAEFRPHATRFKSSVAVPKWSICSVSCYESHDSRNYQLPHRTL